MNKRSQALLIILVSCMSYAYSVEMATQTEMMPSGASCAICLDDTEHDPVNTLVTCSHSYHQHCVDGWRNQPTTFQERGTCPECRQTALFPQEVTPYLKQLTSRFGLLPVYGEELVQQSEHVSGSASRTSRENQLSLQDRIDQLQEQRLEVSRRRARELARESAMRRAPQPQPAEISIKTLITRGALPSYEYLGQNKRRLNLSGRELTSLRGLGNIPGIQGITELLLNDNRITVIPSGIFIPCKKLSDLDLGDNRITQFEPGAFNGLENLVKLSVYRNQLTKIPSGLLGTLKKLEDVDMYGNNFSPSEKQRIVQEAENAVSGRRAARVVCELDNE